MCRTNQTGVLIIGTGAAGTTAASELRTLGYDGKLTLVNAEADAPYNRTAVNKGLLQQAVTLASVALPLPGGGATTVWHGRRVTAVDSTARTADLDTGERLGYDALLVATGAAPRTLGVALPPEVADRILVLRTAADATALRSALDRAARRRGGDDVRVGIVGAGLLGAETADTLGSEGVAVTLIDPDPAPLDRLFGETVGAWVRSQQHARLTPAFGASVLEVRARGDAVALVLSDGRTAVVDVVLVAAGVTPSTACLSTSLPATRDGVLVDEWLRVPGAARLYAAGDVARLRRGAAVLRGEHWGYALAQGRHAARTIAHDLGVGADPGPFTAPESFATRLHGRAVTVLGRPGAAVREVVVAGSATDGAVTLGFVDDGERLVGAVSLGRPGVLNKLRPLVAARASVEEARLLVDHLAPTPR